jgi:hypothetical protein
MSSILPIGITTRLVPDAQATATRSKDHHHFGWDNSNQPARWRPLVREFETSTFGRQLANDRLTSKLDFGKVNSVTGPSMRMARRGRAKSPSEFAPG